MTELTGYAKVGAGIAAEYGVTECEQCHWGFTGASTGVPYVRMSDGGDAPCMEYHKKRFCPHADLIKAELWKVRVHARLRRRAREEFEWAITRSPKERFSANSYEPAELRATHCRDCWYPLNLHRKTPEELVRGTCNECAEPLPGIAYG